MKKVTLDISAKNNTIEASSYKFKPTRKIYIANTPSDIDSQCYCDGDVWQWHLKGRMITLNWQELKIPNSLCELLKGFIFYRLQTKSSGTAYVDLGLVHYIAKHPALHKIPWSKKNILIFLKSSPKNVNRYISTKLFYKWCLSKNIKEFNLSTYKFLSENKLKKTYPYKNIYLRQNYIEAHKINEISQKLNEPLTKTLSLKELQLKILLRLCIELAPRASQIYALNQEDLIIFEDKETNTEYFALNLPLAKKMTQKNDGYRIRAISSTLAKEIQILIKSCKKESAETNALFVSSKFKRYSAYTISLYIKKSNSFGFSIHNFRHYLAQSLADQGASIEVIADILGHSSTFAARAYIAATPKIASIKTRALARNKVYNKLMNLFVTGETIDKSSIEKNKHIKGIVGEQYIGEIGACGLKSNCPKNPIYSCYSCSKFHPFFDGDHENVLKGLEKNINLFFDVGYSKNDIRNNRTILQLQDTILSVKHVINSIKKNTL